MTDSLAKDANGIFPEILFLLLSMIYWLFQIE